MKVKETGIPSWVYLLLGFLAFAIFYIGKQLTKEDIMRLTLGKRSEVVLAAMGRNKLSPRILRHTGKIVHRSFQAGPPGSKQDSLTFRITLKGEKASATIQTTVQRLPSGKWEVTKSDTVYSN